MQMQSFTTVCWQKKNAIELIVDLSKMLVKMTFFVSVLKRDA